MWRALVVAGAMVVLSSGCGNPGASGDLSNSLDVTEPGPTGDTFEALPEALPSDVSPVDPGCDSPNPAGGKLCSAKDCAQGYACPPGSGQCVPSSCECYAKMNEWICTADCDNGNHTSCILDLDVPLSDSDDAIGDAGQPDTAVESMPDAGVEANDGSDDASQPPADSLCYDTHVTDFVSNNPCLDNVGCKTISVTCGSCACTLCWNEECREWVCDDGGPGCGGQFP